MGIGFCIKDKEKVELLNEVRFFSKNGVPMGKGTCPKCGNKINRIYNRAERDALKQAQLRGEKVDEQKS